MTAGRAIGCMVSDTASASSSRVSSEMTRELTRPGELPAAWSLRPVWVQVKGQRDIKSLDELPGDLTEHAGH